MDTNKHEFDRAIALTGPHKRRAENAGPPVLRLPVVAVLAAANALYNYCTAPYRRWRRPYSSTAAKRSFFVKSGHSFGVTYISV